MAIDYDAWKHPTTEIVQRYADAFDLNYHKSDEEISEAFDEELSEEVVEKRVHLINAYYHTRVPVKETVPNMVDHILVMEHLGEMISNGEAKAVNIIAEC